MAAKTGAGKSRVAIRPLATSDVPAVTRILKSSPEAANWSERSIAEAAAYAGAVVLVSELGSEVTGFLIGRATGDEAEILNIAVARERRRRGDGGALLEAVLAEFKVRRVKRIFLEVRDSNESAIAFYSKHSFSKVGRRPGYYREPEEAALLMEKIFTA
jgi:[ribosomal protein S18]-alanine N-acetyltransferase